MKLKSTPFLVILAALLAAMCFAAQAQPENVTETTPPKPEELLKKIADLDSAYHTLLEIDDERYNDAVKTITRGLQNASDIQILLPNSLLLLTYSDLKTLEANINNPTFDGIGDRFTDQIVEAAAEHLILEYEHERNLEPEQTTKGRFKKFLSGLFNNSTVQLLLKSNPITGFISSALAHAGVFERPRTAEVLLTGSEIRALSAKANESVTMSFTTSPVSNIDGPAYDLPMVDRFYETLNARVEFYHELAIHGDSIRQMNVELKLEAYALQKQIKTGRTIICTTLGIDEQDYYNSLRARLASKRPREWLRDRQFEKAVALANQANEMLPEVIRLHTTIVQGAIRDVKGHRAILTKYIDNPTLALAAKLDANKLKQRRVEFTHIQAELENYLPKKK